jgi:hypothetical protein
MSTGPQGEKSSFVSKKLCIGAETRNEAQKQVEKHVFIGFFEDFGGCEKSDVFWKNVYI